MRTSRRLASERLDPRINAPTFRGTALALARLGGRTPVGRDTVVAALLVVVGLGRIPLALLVNGGRLPSPGWVVAAATVASTLDFATIAVRRRAPRVALGAAVVVVVGATALPAAYTLTGIGVLVCAYTVATLLPRRQAIVVLAVGCAGHAAGGIVSAELGGHLHLVATYWANAGGNPVDVVLASIGSFAIPGLAGLYVQTTRAYAAELAATAATEAAAEERARIARELHDVAAHDLSAIVVQAGAADRLLDRDPERSREVLRSIRAQGRRTLTAMRELVGILRARPTTSPQPSLSMMDDLVTSARDTGMAVTVRTSGTPAPLSPATDVAAYRLVQEALTNARQHAPGAPVDVSVAYRAADVTLTVHNGPAESRADTDGGGHGLLGMRERVRHCGGDLDAGPTGAGGWRITARLPLAEREPA
jgi:signal transduction histidine kinase